MDVNPDGQCIVITCSTVAYELTKQVLGRHFAGSIKKHDAFLKYGVDKSNNRVDMSLKVLRKGSKYTVNFYNTTSKVDD